MVEKKSFMPESQTVSLIYEWEEIDDFSKSSYAENCIQLYNKFSNLELCTDMKLLAFENHLCIILSHIKLMVLWIGGEKFDFNFKFFDI